MLKAVRVTQRGVGHARITPDEKATGGTGLWFGQARGRDYPAARPWRCPRGGSDGGAWRDGAGERGGDVDVGSRKDTAAPGRRLRARKQSVAAHQGPPSTHDTS